jgi:RHS repeat-associated protein
MDCAHYLRSSVLGGQVVAEITSGGMWWRGYVYLGGQLLAVQYGSAVSWVHQDPFVKSKRVTDASGNVISISELDPWGGTTNRDSNGAFQPQKFNSYIRDGNAADDAMFRRYNRWWSRFDQPDPYDGSNDLTNPQSFNRYAYVQNDPINLIDPLGLDPGGVLGGALSNVPLGPGTSFVTVNIPQDTSLIGSGLGGDAHSQLLFINDLHLTQHGGANALATDDPGND